MSGELESSCGEAEEIVEQEKSAREVTGPSREMLIRGMKPIPKAAHAEEVIQEKAGVIATFWNGVKNWWSGPSKEEVVQDLDDEAEKTQRTFAFFGASGQIQNEALRNQAIASDKQRAENSVKMAEHMGSIVNATEIVQLATSEHLDGKVVTNGEQVQNVAAVTIGGALEAIRGLAGWAKRLVRGGGSKGIAPVLDALPGKIGKTGPIKEVPDAKALSELFDSLSVGGKTLPSGTYPGTVKELIDGTIVRMRPGSKSGGATIDITMPDGTLVKVHIK